MTDLSLAGHAGAFSMTSEANQLILDYLAGVRESTSADADGDETVRDIETAIGDRLYAVLSGGDEIDKAAVAGILDEFGPLDMQNGVSSRKAPLLCRIEEGKQISGLCLGIATRTDLRVDWVRSIAVILGLFTGGLLVIAYLVALLFAPRLRTVSEYQHAIRVGKRSRNAPGSSLASGR